MGAALIRRPLVLVCLCLGSLPPHIMRAADWCPSTVVALKKKIRFARMKENFANPTSSKVHDQSRLYNDNQRESLQVDESQYRTKHALDACLCRQCRPTVDVLRSRVLHNDIPLVRVRTEASRDRLSVELEKSDYSGDFVAISHGNAQGNSQSQCTLLMIQRCVDSLKDSGSGVSTSFWMDTMPTDCPERDPEDGNINLEQIFCPCDKGAHR